MTASGLTRQLIASCWLHLLMPSVALCRAPPPWPTSWCTGCTWPSCCKLLQHSPVYHKVRTLWPVSALQYVPLELVVHPSQESQCGYNVKISCIVDRTCKPFSSQHVGIHSHVVPCWAIYSICAVISRVLMHTRCPVLCSFALGNVM